MLPDRTVYLIEIPEPNPFDGICFSPRSIAEKHLNRFVQQAGVGPGSPQDFIGSGKAFITEIDVVTE